MNIKNALRKIIGFLVAITRRAAGVIYLIPTFTIAAVLYIVIGIIAFCIIWPLEWLFTGDDVLFSIFINFLDIIFDIIGEGFEAIVGDY